MERSYYSRAVADFCREGDDSILGALTRNLPRNARGTQLKAWREQISILKRQLGDLESGHLILEYSIPRMGERADVILIYSDFVFVMEFKTGRTRAEKAVTQCLDYAVDLKNFHRESRSASIVPVLILTDAEKYDNKIVRGGDGVYGMVFANRDDVGAIIKRICSNPPDSTVKVAEWECSRYEPTPTIIEAARAVCRKRGKYLRTRTDENVRNIDRMTRAIGKVIAQSKQNGRKSICFVTGVPGSGKTLAGLDIVCRNQSNGERAVFFTGNDPLTRVLRKALSEKDAERRYGAGAEMLVQHIKDFVADTDIPGPPSERIVIFDEAQRAWTAEKMSSKTGDRLGPKFRGKSQPEILLEVMGRHDGWAAIICLVGSGQEIHTGEAGISEWFKALGDLDWDVYLPGTVGGAEYADGLAPEVLPRSNCLKKLDVLHLGTSVRSFRSENVSRLVNEILDCNTDSATELFFKLKNEYPIRLTRDLGRAKEWLRDASRGSERYGLVASSNAKRLRPFGICLGSKINPVPWFLAGKEDPLSSYGLEVVATEFDTQGLELDWVCLAWDGDLRFENGGWSPYKFRGREWKPVKQLAAAGYLVNAYRVLMTRARQGMVIFVPHGDGHDDTRRSEFYDRTYEYLRSIGLEEI